ncbi:transcriptional attenuator, LytR family [Anaeromicropila populeti]|uniref:Transcriptional attenuator, LytR family n=2 Tax=Anaeromicropila populeti TaxID=37658 RepID=A0A1I6IU58_9FIRM|nr:transcriptional attenuator, LytR family [Anaeromicropila populeti]
MIDFFLTVLVISAGCSFLICMAVLLDKIFCKKYSRHWNYIVWFLIAIRLLLPLNVQLVKLPFVENKERAAVVVTNQNINETDKNKQTILSKNNQEEAKSVQSDHTDFLLTEKETDSSTQIKESGNHHMPWVSFESIIKGASLIWMIGVFLVMLYHIMAYMSFQKKISKWCHSVRNSEIHNVLQELCTEMDIKEEIRLVTCPLIHSPMLTGFRNPVIVLPTKEFTLEQYSFILKHELVHYKNHDLYYKLLLLCATGFHWFNPLVHYMARTAYSDIELYCDEKVVKERNLQYREEYSLTLLQIMSGTYGDNILLTTGFSEKKKQVKKRVYQIMNIKPTKRGTSIIIGVICVIFLISNITGSFLPSKVSKAETIGVEVEEVGIEESITETEKNESQDLLEKASHILVVGLDGTNDDTNVRADSILIVSINPVSKKVVLTSFLRDMYLSVPEIGENKLSAVYSLGGIQLVEDTIETNFQFSIDHTISVNMKAFETIIDAIGGVELELSEKEAEYLNQTNYISKKECRNVLKGRQRLNGSQALGYVRVRQVSDENGENGEFGRTARLRKLLSAIMKEYKKQDIMKIGSLFLTIQSEVTTDLSYTELLTYLRTVCNDTVTASTASIPVIETYTLETQQGMSVLVPDLDKNIKAFEKFTG